jgi:hypothetical protein
VTLLRNLPKAVPDLISAWLIYLVWVDPAAFGGGWFRPAVFTLLLEFFVLHAGGFMAVTVFDPQASRRKRLLRLGGWTAGYLLFISAFAKGFDAWWIVGAFAWFCFAKVQAIWTGAPPTERDRFHAMLSWALGVLAFLGAIFLTVEGEVPALGVTPEVVAAAGFGSGGVWEKEPHRALAGAVLYFAVMGLLRPVLGLLFATRNELSTQEN